MPAVHPSPTARKMAALRARRRTQHQCSACGDPLPETELRICCDACRTKHALMLSQRYYRLAGQHDCITCGVVHTTRYVRCQACHEKNKLSTATARGAAASLAQRAPLQMTPESRMPVEDALQTKGRHLPAWLQRIQRHNDAYNRQLLIGRMLWIIVTYHARKRGIM